MNKASRPDRFQLQFAEELSEEDLAEHIAERNRLYGAPEVDDSSDDTDDKDQASRG